MLGHGPPATRGVARVMENSRGHAEQASGHPAFLEGRAASAPQESTQCRASPAYRRLVASLVHRGHGIEALCFFLALPRDALTDLVVQLDLPTPVDTVFKPRGGAHAWTQNDYVRLLTAWEGDWRCGAIAETLGRSKSSIWAKARRLGLPTRERQSLRQPATIAPPRLRQLDLFARLSDAPLGIWPPPADIRQWKARGTAEDVVIRRKQGRDEIEWTRDLCQHVQNRFWSGQRNKSVAADLGISLRAITSMKCRMQIPRDFPREWLSAVFRPEKAAEHIAAMGYVERSCKKNPNYTYWLLPRKHTRSRRDCWTGYYLGEH